MKIEIAGNYAQNPHNSPFDAQGANSVYCVHRLGGIENLFSDLRSAGVVLSIDRDGRLEFDGPDHVLTDDRLATMRAHRDGLLALVASVENKQVPDPVVSLSGVICPYCRSMAFEDVERGWQCCDCKRLAWIWLPGGSIVRADAQEIDLGIHRETDDREVG